MSKTEQPLVEFGATAKVSSKYQVVVPREVRERLGIKPGDKLRFYLLDGYLHVVKVRTIAELGGTLKGCDAAFEREEDDRY